MRLFPVIGNLLLALSLTGCAANTLSLTGAETAPPSGGMPAMAGRWILAAPNAPTCGMNFTGTGEGAVSPEGGCPGDFFLGRRWRLAAGKLTIAGEDGNALGVFAFSNNVFAGKDNAGTPVTLTPPSP